MAYSCVVFVDVCFISVIDGGTLLSQLLDLQEEHSTPFSDFILFNQQVIFCYRGLFAVSATKQKRVLIKYAHTVNPECLPSRLLTSSYLKLRHFKTIPNVVMDIAGTSPVSSRAFWIDSSDGYFKLSKSVPDPFSRHCLIMLWTWIT